jgi:hypothetical protein
MNWTELFQFGFKTVGYGSIFLVRFGLVFLPTPSFYRVFCFCTHLQIELEIRYNTAGKILHPNLFLFK